MAIIKENILDSIVSMKQENTVLNSNNPTFNWSTNKRNQEVKERLDKITAEFSCPLNKSNYYALCDGCPFKSSNWCKEWEKKRGGACGCRGDGKCICGFHVLSCSESLYGIDYSICPYC